ncbi:L-2-amino-thiazoline-4-carboxylic acid hydrolase [Acidobacteriota bacterium]
MNNSNDLRGLSRRRFLSRVVPACSLVCLGAAGRSLWGEPTGIRQDQQEADKSPRNENMHKFDREFPRKLTNRQFMDVMYGREFIPFLKLMSAEIGEDRLIPMLEKHSEAEGLEVGTMLAKQFGGSDFAIWKKIFQPDAPNLKVSLTMSITEDTDTVHELKVTECLWADVFLRAGAGNLGRAAKCHGDYAMATSFNPRLKMVRDKTLMQGHAYCNHRYLLTG